MFVVEFEGRDADGITVYRYSSYMSWSTRPTDIPANTAIEERIIQPVNLGRYAFGQGATMGDARMEVGELVLNNADGALDFLADVAVDGRKVTLYQWAQDPRRPNDPPPVYPAGWRKVFTGTMVGINVAWRRVTIGLLDRMGKVFDQPLQTHFYGGTNALPDGVDGTVDDIKGLPIPKGYGRVNNATATCVNTSRLIYQLNDGAMEAVLKVYDSAVELTFDADYPDVASLVAATIAPGHYATCLALGYFRLGGSPAGGITADFKGDKTGGVYVETAADIVRRVWETAGGIAPADISASSLSALNTANPAPLQFFSGLQETTIGAVVSQILGSVGAAPFISRGGMFSAKRLELPAGPAEASFDTINISDSGQGLERAFSEDRGQGLPAWRVTVRCGKNWTIQEGTEIAGSVTDARRAYLGQEYRATDEDDAQDVAVQMLHPLAVDLTIDTLFTQEADAAAEAVRQFVMRSVRRDTFRVRAQIEDCIGLDILDTLEVIVPRFGLADGKLFAMLSISENGATGFADMEVWG